MIAPSCTRTPGRRGPVIEAPTPSHRSNLLVVPCLGLGGSGWVVGGERLELEQEQEAKSCKQGRGLVVVCNNWDTGDREMFTR